MPIEKSLSFYKGQTKFESAQTDGSNSDSLTHAKREVKELLGSKNLSFLLGSGCSSLVASNKVELGIRTMAPMAQRLLDPSSAEASELTRKYDLDSEDIKELSSEEGISINSEQYQSNLETLLGALYSAYSYVEAAEALVNRDDKLQRIDRIIGGLKRYIFDSCNLEIVESQDDTVLGIYRQFYRNLTLRQSNLPRATVFTTNYDLFNEIAMERSGISYVDGFSGYVEPRFDPTGFRQTVAQRLDVTAQRWSPLDNLVYLVKLHGSVNWKSNRENLFPVTKQQIDGAIDGSEALIYPTPAKQNASFASPYSDLFREFQARVVQEQSALIVIGYSFGDDHVNNILLQALTIPTFRMLVLARPPADHDNNLLAKLFRLNDPRVWIMGTEGDEFWKGHYFRSFVEDIMTSEHTDGAETAILNIRQLLGNGPRA